jgi:hypothetical protein
MAEIVNGAARWYYSGTFFVFDCATHTIDGYARENVAGQLSRSKHRDKWRIDHTWYEERGHKHGDISPALAHVGHLHFFPTLYRSVPSHFVIPMLKKHYMKLPNHWSFV